MSTSGSSDGPCWPSSSVKSSGGEKGGTAAEVGLLYPAAGPAILTQRLSRFPLSPCVTPRRRKREMTPASKKDATYWDKRQKNNKAAKRSRDKRRFNSLMMEREMLALVGENTQLRAEVFTMQYHLSGGLNIAAPPWLSFLQHYPYPAPYLYPASGLFQAGGMWGQGGGGMSPHPAFMLGMKQHEIASYHLGPGWPALAPDGGLTQSGYEQEPLQYLPLACTPPSPHSVPAFSPTSNKPIAVPRGGGHDGVPLPPGPVPGAAPVHGRGGGEAACRGTGV